MRVRISKYGKYWAVFENEILLCVCVYKKGAEAVLARIS